MPSLFSIRSKMLGWEILTNCKGHEPAKLSLKFFYFRILRNGSLFTTMHASRAESQWNINTTTSSKRQQLLQYSEEIWLSLREICVSSEWISKQLILPVIDAFFSHVLQATTGHVVHVLFDSNFWTTSPPVTLRLIIIMLHSSWTGLNERRSIFMAIGEASVEGRYVQDT